MSDDAVKLSEAVELAREHLAKEVCPPDCESNRLARAVLAMAERETRLRALAHEYTCGATRDSSKALHGREILAILDSAAPATEPATPADSAEVDECRVYKAAGYNDNGIEFCADCKRIWSGHTQEALRAGDRWQAMTQKRRADALAARLARVRAECDSAYIVAANEILAILDDDGTAGGGEG